MGTDRTPRRVSAIATGQHGIVSRSQLLRAGFSRGQIQSRITSGYLSRCHRGVYAVGHAALSTRSAWVAAVMFAGEGAVLSHRSAAALWGLMPARETVEVTRPRRGLSMSGLIIHSTRLLPDSHTTVVDGIAVTTVARTLTDLAAVDRPEALDDRLSAARRLRLLDCDQVRRAIALRPTRKGAGELTARLELFEEMQAATRSELETRFLRLCREGGLPLPEVDVEMGSTVADFLWRHQRLIVEVDGFRFHHHRFDEDRRRDLGRLVNGYRTVRVTHTMMRKDPGRLIESLRLLLDYTGS